MVQRFKAQGSEVQGYKEHEKYKVANLEPDNLSS
jgi:hypothetical protein